MRTTAGLLVPIDDSAGTDEPAVLSFANTFVTWEELTGKKLSEPEIAERLADISAYDCLHVLGQLSCMVHSERLTSRAQQTFIMEHLLGWTPDARALLEERMNESDGGTRVVFFPQQVVHLARLAVRHADERPADGFGDEGRLVGPFIECLLGVSDVFEEEELDDEDPRSAVPWILRQWAINGRQDSPLLWSRYYDVLVRSWDEVAAETPEAFDAAAAFQRYTGMEMRDWLTTGLALFGKFLTYGKDPVDDFLIHPGTLFASAAIDEDVWSPFLEANAQTLEECRDAIEDEERRYGATQYRCQAFETKPLLKFPDGRLGVLALDSLERRCTEGMFFELADGATGQGLPREEFTSPFGAVFEEFVQRAWERMLPEVPGLRRVHRPKQYMRGDNEVDSTDAVLDAGARDVVFCEIVARRPRVATLTHGDTASFMGDLEDGPLKKVRQLHLNIEDYREGRLDFGRLRFERGQRIWPVLVMVEGFPTMPPIPAVIADEIARRGWLQDLPPLAILGSEDLGHMEGLVEAGLSIMDLLEAWKGNPETADLPLSNFLSGFGEAQVSTTSQAVFYRKTWDELTDLIKVRLFPGAD